MNTTNGAQQVAPIRVDAMSDHRPDEDGATYQGKAKGVTRCANEQYLVKALRDYLSYGEELSKHGRRDIKREYGLMEYARAALHKATGRT